MVQTPYVKPLLAKSRFILPVNPIKSLNPVSKRKPAFFGGGSYIFLFLVVLKHHLH